MKLQLAAVLGALAITSPVYAQDSSHLGGKATLAANPVIQAILDSNIDVVMNDPEDCSDKDLHGASITYKGNAYKPELLICMNNHDTHADLADTIRHEAHHAVVYCNGGRTLFNWQENLKIASVVDIGTVVKLYDVHDHNEELEARNVAKVITDEKVANKVREFCM